MPAEKKLKNDILLVLALLILAGGVWLFLRLTRQEGAEAIVTVDGVEAARLPLDTDTVRTFETGAFSNTVVVENGCVYVSEANCPDLICVHQGAVRYDGETIVCLPHKLIVTVTGGEWSGLDAATW